MFKKNQKYFISDSFAQELIFDSYLKKYISVLSVHILETGKRQCKNNIPIKKYF